MFGIGLTVVCAIFMIGYIFFAVAGSEGESPEQANSQNQFKDAA